MTTKNGQRIPAQRRIDAAARQSKHLHPDGPRGVQEVPEMFLHGIRRPLCFAVEGDCLAPLGIVDGDSVLVDQANTTPQHGEIIACKLNGTLLLKAYLCADTALPRLGYTERGRFLSIPVMPADTLEIIGVVGATMPTGRRAWPDDAEEWAKVPILQAADLRDFPYWTVDNATGEWVRRTPDGTEIARHPLAHVTGAESEGA